MRKILLLGSAIAVVLLSFAAHAADPWSRQISWTAKGDTAHPWTDANNWSYANAPTLPLPNDRVMIGSSGADILVDDDSAALASTMYQFYFTGSNSVIWCVTTNSSTVAKLGRWNSTGGGLVKVCDSELTLVDVSNVGQFDYDSYIYVRKGLLRLPDYRGGTIPAALTSNPTAVIGIVTVDEGATIAMLNGDSKSIVTTFKGLMCSGTLTNENQSVVHNFSTRTDSIASAEHPNEIRGHIRGKINFEPYGPIDIYSTDNVLNKFNPMTDSGQAEENVVGLYKFGSKTSASDTSMGVTGSLGYTWDSVIFKYLGTGETTDRDLNMNLHTSFASWANNRPVGLDGGPHGGLVFAGKISQTTQFISAHRLLLTGSNAVPCTIAGASDCSKYDDANGLYSNYCVIKRGSGVWTFSNNTARIYAYYGSGMTGCFLIEEGTIRAESITERGSLCSLGTAAHLYGDFYGKLEDAPTVEWAYSFGTADADGNPLTEGTLEFIGTNLHACASDRRSVLIGNGRLKNSSPDRFMAFDHVKAGSAGSKTITLDGDNTLTNVLQEVSDGAGTVSVAKDGAGTWFLRGNQTFSGDLTVNAGTLVVENPTNDYTYFNFVARKVGNDIMQLGEIALYDAETNQINKGLVLPSRWKGNNDKYDMDARYMELASGVCDHGRYSPTAIDYPSGNSYKGFFDGTATTGGCSYYGYRAANPLRFFHNNPVKFRLADGKPKAAYYDICAHTANDNRHPFAWTFRGSRDGLLWDDLDERSYDQYPGYSNWYSDGSAFVSGKAAKPFEIRGNSATVPKSLEKVAYVSVAKGATLKTDYENVGTISKLRFPTAGGGTISGFKFAETGTIDIEGEVERGKELKIPYELGDGETAANVADWGFTINGEVSTKFDLVAGPHGCTLKPHGLLLLVR